MTPEDLFQAAVAVVLANEGGRVDDPLDPGGITAYGIALRRHPELTLNDILTMTPERATEIYRIEYWAPFRWAELPAPIAIKAFDCSIPAGPSPAIEALQRACRASGRPLVDDGDLGDLTVAAANAIDPAALLPALRSELAGHFRLVEAAHPLQAKDVSGWLNRAYA